MQHRKQRRVDNEGLGVAHDELRHDGGVPEGLKEAPELAQPALQRRRFQEADHPGEEVGEEPAYTLRKKERSDSTPLSCWKIARGRTSESESCLRDS